MIFGVLCDTDFVETYMPPPILNRVKGVFKYNINTWLASIEYSEDALRGSDFKNPKDDIILEIKFCVNCCHFSYKKK